MMQRIFVAFVRVISIGVLGLCCQVGAHADELDTCVSTAKRTNIRCWNECTGDDDAVSECTADCDADFEARKERCRNAVRSGASAGSELSGTKKGGQDGCYFGECPKDLDERIEQSEPDEQAPEKKVKPRRPRQQQPANEPLAGFPPNAPSAQLTRICQTPAYWCVMNAVGVVNNSCWCASPLGIAYGITVPER